MGNRKFEIAARDTIVRLAKIALNDDHVALVTAKEKHSIFIHFKSNFLISYDIHLEEEMAVLAVKSSTGEVCGVIDYSDINRIKDFNCKYFIYQLFDAVGSKDISSIKDTLEKMR